MWEVLYFEIQHNLLLNFSFLISTPACWLLLFSHVDVHTDSGLGAPSPSDSAAGPVGTARPSSASLQRAILMKGVCSVGI